MAAFAAWLCEAEMQRTVVLTRGGPPAHRTVWSSPTAPDFFHDTRSSMEHAYVRPAHPAWPAFHRDAGADLAAAGASAVTGATYLVDGGATAKLST